jgi:AcrB/AcrD/AcrF family
MRWILELILKFRLMVVALAAGMLLAGISQLRAMPVDVLPEFDPPYVEVQTEALGLSAEEVEQLITVPLEQDLLNGVAWIDSMRSESVPGLSSIVLTFKPRTDLYRARQMVGERLTQAFALPHVSKPPTMMQPMSSTSRVLLVGLSSKSVSPIDLSVLARWTVGPRLMGVAGVSSVAIWGQRDRQLQVQVDPRRLRDQKVSLLQVMETTGNAMWVSSLSWVEASTPGHRRLHRDQLAAAGDPACLSDHIGQRSGGGACRGHAVPAGRYSHGCGGPPTADRRRRRECRRGSPARRREAPGCQHSGGDPGGGRKGAQCHAAGRARRGDRLVNLPPCQLHRAGD